jgi:hypothetical protein
VLADKTPAEVSSLLIEKWTKELTVIAEHFPKRSLDFVSLQVPWSLLTDSSSSSSSEATVFALVSSLRAAKHPILSATKTFALDFHTGSLAAVQSNAQVSQAVQQLQRGWAKSFLSGVTVACNGQSFHYAHQLVSSLQSHHCQARVLATELLRCDSQRPAQLSANYDHHMPHQSLHADSLDEQQENQQEQQKEPPVDRAMSGDEARIVQKIQLATKDFEQSLDRCIQLEKKFLTMVSAACHCHSFYECTACCYYTDTNHILPNVTFQHADKIAELKVNVTQVCLGHVLSSAHAQFASPEEWDHVLHHQVSVCGSLMVSFQWLLTDCFVGNRFHRSSRTALMPCLSPEPFCVIGHLYISRSESTCWRHTDICCRCGLSTLEFVDD